jgi:hypothetical protein
MVIISVIVNGRYASSLPVFKADWIWFSCTNESKAFLKVVKSGTISGYCIQEVSHRWIVGALLVASTYVEKCRANKITLSRNGVTVK